MRTWITQLRRYEQCRQIVLEGLQSELEDTKERLVSAAADQVPGLQQQALWLRTVIKELRHDG